MTLQGYLNQKDPQRLASGSVQLTRDEIKVHGTIKHITSVTVKALKLTYYVQFKSGILYTQNEDGTPKSESVFS